MTRVSVVVLLNGQAITTRHADSLGLVSMTEQGFRTDDGRMIAVDIRAGYTPIAVDLLMDETAKEQQPTPSTGVVPNPGPVRRL